MARIQGIAQPMMPLLTAPDSNDVATAGDLVLVRFVAKLPGQAWRRPRRSPE